MTEISSYSATAASYDYAQARRDMFSNADSDGDAKLSIEEFIAAKPADAPEGGPDSSEIFASLDTDEDGYLTEEEMAAGGPPRGGPPPGPPPNGDSEELLSTDMLSQLLQAIEEGLSSSETESASTTEETDESDTSDVEDDILSLIQEELENYRNSSSPYAQAAQAYGQYQAQALAGQTLAQG